MGNKAPAGYSSVATDEEAPPTDVKDAKKKLPIADQIEPIAPQAAPTPALKKDSKIEDKKPEKSRFSSESLRDTVRVLRLVLPYVWPKNSTMPNALTLLAERDHCCRYTAARSSSVLRLLVNPWQVRDHHDSCDVQEHHQRPSRSRSSHEPCRLRTPEVLSVR